jgi:hypothetical protein
MFSLPSEPQLSLGKTSPQLLHLSELDHAPFLLGYLISFLQHEGTLLIEFQASRGQSYHFRTCCVPGALFAKSPLICTVIALE